VRFQDPAIVVLHGRDTPSILFRLGKFSNRFIVNLADGFEGSVRVVQDQLPGTLSMVFRSPCKLFRRGVFIGSNGNPEIILGFMLNNPCHIFGRRGGFGKHLNSIPIGKGPGMGLGTARVGHENNVSGGNDI
jgi:hypothetical protein